LPVGVFCALTFFLVESCSQPPSYFLFPGSGSNPFRDAVDMAFDPSGNLLVGGVTGTSGSQLPCYWENGPLVMTLPVGPGNYAFSIGWGTVDLSGNFFIAGAVGTTSDSLIPCYWDNGALSFLIAGTEAGWLRESSQAGRLYMPPGGSGRPPLPFPLVSGQTELWLCGRWGQEIRSEKVSPFPLTEKETCMSRALSARPDSPCCLLTGRTAP